MNDKTDSKEREAFEAWASRSIGRVWRDTTPGRTDCYQDASTNIGWRAWQARASVAANAGSEPVALPFAILADEMAALRRFDECVRDDGSYDISKEMMKRLAGIGLVRRLTGNVYEHTTFGLSVLQGDFATHPSPPEGMVAEQALRKVLSVVQRYLPPDGPTAHDAMTEITEIVDPWPLGPLEKS